MIIWPLSDLKEEFNLEKTATLNKQPSREEIPNEYKWKLTDIYSSDEAWEADFRGDERKRAGFS